MVKVTGSYLCWWGSIPGKSCSSPIARLITALCRRGCKALSEKVITSLESCHFMEVFRTHGTSWQQPVHPWTGKLSKCLNRFATKKDSCKEHAVIAICLCSESLETKNQNIKYQMPRGFHLTNNPLLDYHDLMQPFPTPLHSGFSHCSRGTWVDKYPSRRQPTVCM